MIHRATIIIVEDNTDMRIGLETLLKDSESFICVASFPSFEAGQEAIGRLKPSIVLMDIDLPGLSGIEATKRIKANLPTTEVLIVSVFENSEYVFEALKAGASGYLTKNMRKDQLIEALSDIMNGGAPMSAKIARKVVASFQTSAHTSPLTEKESRILSTLSQGKSIKTAAQMEDISPNTVKFHLKNIYLKLQVSCKEDAVELAKNKKWI